MEAHRFPLVLLLVTAGALPSLSFAGEGRPSLEDRVTALEDELRESRQLIQAQRDVLEKHDLETDADVAQGSAVDPFLQSINIGGHIAASYGYSFNNPGVNAGANTLCSFQCNHNELSLDAAKLEIGRPASEPGKLGFQFDLLLGQNANIQGSLAPAVDSNSTPNGVSSDQEIFLQQAYASYNANGVEIKLGKFETLLGYELFDTDANANITQGVLFTFAIPAFHTGLLLGGSLSEEVTWNAGLVNGFNNTRESGDAKAFMGRLGWSRGPALVALSSYIGTLGETRTTSQGLVVGDNSRDTQIYDLILEYKPTERLKTWANFDVGRTDNGLPGSDPTFFGVALGTKLQLSEKLYLAVRGEYMNDDQGSRFGPLGLAIGAIGPESLDEIDVYTATVTLGYQLGPGLLARLEYRHDDVDCDSSCNFFPDQNSAAGPQGEDTNDLAVFELVYSFD
jgi:hypothetical protein